jgi:hypothetical protein
MPRRDYSIFSRIGKSPETYYGDSKPYSELPEPAAQETRRVLRSLTARAAVLPAVVLGDTERTEITASYEATGELLDQICTRRLRVLRNFIRRYRGALFTLHVVCRPVTAQRVKVVLGAPALYDSRDSGDRLRICYAGAGPPPREIIVLARGRIYAWCGLSVSFSGGPRSREIIREALFVVTVRPEPPRTLRPPPACGSALQLSLAL